MRVIIDYFYEYPLMTQKWPDYKLFKQVFQLTLNKEHLTLKGLHKIVAIKKCASPPAAKRTGVIGRV